MNFRFVVLVAFCWLPLHSFVVAAAAGETRVLRVAVAQKGLEPTLVGNRDKTISLTKEAAAAGARVVVFPEGSLASPPGTSLVETQSAVTAVAKAAREANIYIITGERRVPHPPLKGRNQHRNKLFVFSPDGEILLEYDKDNFANKPGDPKLISIDGVLASVIICSDRWSRPVESLPPVLGAQVIFECSNNYDTEWLPQLEWYWYVPRAIRNTAFVIFSNSASDNRLPGSQRGHGHTAVIAPDGSILASAGEDRDKIVLADLDLTQATREMAIRRSQHPLFKEWWDMAKAAHGGKKLPAADVASLVSSNQSVKAGFALMASTPSIEKNVQTILNDIKQAAALQMDLLVFPELAVTGDRDDNIKCAKPAELAAAIEIICRSAQDNKLTVVVGAPCYMNGKLRNSAYVIGSDGAIKTRYDQIVVSRPELFEGGLSTKAMWFQVNGIWSFVTIGDDLTWNEMAELAALRGARLHCHLSHKRHRSPAEALTHDQFVASFASFRMLTIAANPIYPELQGDAHARFSVGSGVWDDLEAGDWCAVKLNVGRPWEGVFSAPRITPGPTNPLQPNGYWKKGRWYQSWMLAGAHVMDSELRAASN